MKNLELKIEQGRNNEMNDNFDSNVPRKCRHHDRGFCKFKENCQNLHTESICEEFLKKEKCEIQGCLLRHPKNCFYWGKKEEGCRRKNVCQYLHRDSKKYCLVKPKVNDMFPCNKCKNKFTCSDSLDQHIKITHNTKMYSCDACDYKATEEIKIKTHKDVVHKNVYSCEFCEFESEQNDKLTMHMKSNHELSCDICETKFVTENSLNMHMNYKHHKENMNENKVLCEWCKNNIGQKICIDCSKNCCDPCAIGVNQNSKEIVDRALRRGIINKALETKELICIGCINKRCDAIRKTQMKK